MKNFGLSGSGKHVLFKHCTVCDAIDYSTEWVDCNFSGDVIDVILGGKCLYCNMSTYDTKLETTYVRASDGKVIKIKIEVEKEGGLFSSKRTYKWVMTVDGVETALGEIK